LNQGKISDWNNGTIDRVLDVMETAGTVAEGGMGCKAKAWDRSGNRYRDHVNQSKY
jgi:hypothetical protein